MLQEMHDATSASFDALVVDSDSASAQDIESLRNLTAKWPSLPIFMWSMHQPAHTSAEWTRAGVRASFGKLHREDLLMALKKAGVGHLPGNIGENCAKQ